MKETLFLLEVSPQSRWFCRNPCEITNIPNIEQGLLKCLCGSWADGMKLFSPVQFEGLVTMQKTAVPGSTV